MAIPHLKITETMRNKYYADAKNEIIDFFEIDVNLWGEETLYVTADYWFDVELVVQIKLYKTKRGDKRINIPHIRDYAKAGDYVWFEDISQEDGGLYFRIHIGKELPVDKRKQYEQLQERFG